MGIDISEYLLELNSLLFKQKRRMFDNFLGKIILFRLRICLKKRKNWKKISQMNKTDFFTLYVRDKFNK